MASRMALVSAVLLGAAVGALSSPIRGAVDQPGGMGGMGMGGGGFGPRTPSPGGSTPVPTRPQPHRSRPPPATNFVACINNQAREYGSIRTGFDVCQPVRGFECDESCNGPTTCCGNQTTGANYAWSWVCPNGWNTPADPAVGLQCSDCKGGPWGAGCGDICAHDVMRCHAAFDCPRSNPRNPSQAPDPCEGSRATPYCQPSFNSVNAEAPEPVCLPDKPTRPPRPTRPGGGTRPTEGPCPRGRNDIDADNLAQLSDGEITGGCEQLFADVLEDGQDCDTPITEVLPKFPRQGVTLEQMCCQTCSKQVDPIVEECDDNEAVCVQDMKQFEAKCGAQYCDSAHGTFNAAACQECAHEVFGDEYAICACCIEPFVAKYDSFNWPVEDIGQVFICKDQQ